MSNIEPDPPVFSGEMANGDEVARARITQVFESLRPDLVRFAQWLARDRSIAEDIVQEALLRAWRFRDALKDLASSRAWLLTIVRREHARLYERKRLELVCLNDASEFEGDAYLANDESEIQALRGAIFTLPIEYREPLIMQVLGGFSVEEIARELKLSASAVLTRLFRARNKLRTMYGLTPAPDISANENVQ